MGVVGNMEYGDVILGRGIKLRIERRGIYIWVLHFLNKTFRSETMRLFFSTAGSLDI